MKWIRTDTRLPALPDWDYCSVMVLTAQEGISITRPMIYERTMVRGKRKERWKYYWDKIAEELPDYWTPLPAPPWAEGVPITPEELREMDGKPVWVVPVGEEDWEPHWYVLREGYIAAESKTRRGAVYFLYLKSYGERWLAYRKMIE